MRGVLINALQWITLAVFLITYILIISYPKRGACIALASAAVLLLSGIMPFDQLISTVDWNVLLMIAGIMGIVTLFTESGMPALLGDLIMARTRSVKWAYISLSLFAGIISAFLDNVATVLIVAPVVMDISKRQALSPVPGIIAVALASNLQGAATLVGDATSILLSGEANLNFTDFFFMNGRIGMFWIVQAGALAATAVLLRIFRKHTQPVAALPRTRVNDFFPSGLLIGAIALLILISFIPPESKPPIGNGLICMGCFAVGLARRLYHDRNAGAVKSALKTIDLNTLLLLAGLFMVVGCLNETGVIDHISRLYVSAGGGSLFAVYSLIVWSSVILSAFIDNIPYVASMLPVVTGIADVMCVSPVLLCFGLLCGATLGGNLTVIGSSANITAMGILRKEGYTAGSRAFLRISIPYTLCAVVVGYILIWFIWR
jgi:Na+/H+ antiporter NhaD/arsenite permease-like protein